MCRWFVNRLRHSVVTDRLLFGVQTDAPDLIESVKGTVLLKKGLWWVVDQAISLENAHKFLTSFTGLDEVELFCYDRSFRFTDDWLKLFEALAIYRVTFTKSRCAAGTEALVSFLFGASSTPGSETRTLRSTFDWNGTDMRKAAAEQLIEAAVSCTSTHKTTLLVSYGDHSRDDTEPTRILAKYEGDLRQYSAGDTMSTRHDEGQDDDGYVLNFHKEGFRIQVFCYSGGLQIRRARVEEVGFFPAWLETATAQ